LREREVLYRASLRLIILLNDGAILADSRMRNRSTRNRENVAVAYISTYGARISVCESARGKNRLYRNRPPPLFSAPSPLLPLLIRRPFVPPASPNILIGEPAAT